MSQGNMRLAAPFGSRIDRARAVAFHFEGRMYEGLDGDTIASALMANGRHVLSRSFKLHRPRGVLTMAAQDGNTLVQVGAEPNVFADTRRVENGMKIEGQNYRGTLDDDKDAILDRFSRFLPVGFYYRSFWGPTKNAFLNFWEPIIRKKTGLGRISLDTPHETYDKVHRFCDVLVVGGGAAGLTAALTAAQSGASVILAEENPTLGGAMTYLRANGAADRLATLVHAVSAEPRIQVLLNATCNGWYADNWIAIVQGNRLLKARAKELVIASGAFEQPVVFRNNDLPGIMLGSAAQRLIHQFGVKPGRRAVVLTCNSSGYQVAADLVAAGVTVAAIVDPRNSAIDSAPKGVRVLAGHVLREADGGRKHWHVQRVHATPLGPEAQSSAGQWFDCDLVCVSGGYMPAYQLPLQAGAKLSYEDSVARFQIKELPSHMHLAGSVNGVLDPHDVEIDGARAGADAARQLGFAAVQSPDRPLGKRQASTNFDWPLVPHPKGKDFVDFDEDIQIKDLENTIAEGYSELELVKRFATVGMGPSQGRHSALNTSRVVASKTGRTVAQVGVTTARPPFTAVNLGVLAGGHHTQYRRTPMHFRHVEAGAQMQPVGAWWRPSYYGTRAEKKQCTILEVAAVRDRVGMLDVSTLGSLEVRGIDAAEFLNRFYTTRHDTQPIGRIRYLLLANEMGSLVDDGVAYRIGDDHFYVTSTTGGVGSVYQLMIFMNAQWKLRVDIANATAVFAGINVAGPKARSLLSGISEDIDFSAAGFPYLWGRIGTVAGIPARVMRIGFTGELSYEVHVPYSLGEALWDRLTDAGKSHGLRPYGLEASRILRLEKGHIIIGQDTDAMTTAQEVDMPWAVAMKKPFFLGKRSMEQRTKLGLKRRLVGFASNPGESQIDESCLVMMGGAPVGFVTSVCQSPTLNKTIGLAYAAPDTKVGDSISIRERSGRTVTVPVVSPHFFDPENKRQEV